MKPPQLKLAEQCIQMANDRLNNISSELKTVKDVTRMQYLQKEFIQATLALTGAETQLKRIQAKCNTWPFG